jgi:hypothetical protein
MPSFVLSSMEEGCFILGPSFFASNINNFHSKIGKIYFAGAPDWPKYAPGPCGVP